MKMQSNVNNIRTISASECELVSGGFIGERGNTGPTTVSGNGGSSGGGGGRGGETSASSEFYSECGASRGDGSILCRQQ